VRIRENTIMVRLKELSTRQQLGNHMLINVSPILNMELGYLYFKDLTWRRRRNTNALQWDIILWILSIMVNLRETLVFGIQTLEENGLERMKSLNYKRMALR